MKTLFNITLIVLFILIGCEKQSEVFQYEQFIGYWECESSEAILDIVKVDPIEVGYYYDEGNYKIRNYPKWNMVVSEAKDDQLWLKFEFRFEENDTTICPSMTEQFNITLIDKTQFQIEGVGTLYGWPHSVYKVFIKRENLLECYPKNRII